MSGSIEEWQARWIKDVWIEVSNGDATEFYCLESCLPVRYLHLVHGQLAIGRRPAAYNAAQGFNVLHPSGWDSSCPREQAALKRGVKPACWTEDTRPHARPAQRLVSVTTGRGGVVAASPALVNKVGSVVFLKMFERAV